MPRSRAVVDPASGYFQQRRDLVHGEELVDVMYVLFDARAAAVGAISGSRWSDIET